MFLGRGHQDKAWQDKDHDSSTKGSGIPNDIPNGGKQDGEQNANDHDANVDGVDLDEGFVFVSDHQHEHLTPQDKHDQGEDGEELKQEEYAAHHHQNVVGVKVVQEVLKSKQKTKSLELFVRSGFIQAVIKISNGVYRVWQRNCHPPKIV